MSFWENIRRLLHPGEPDRTEDADEVTPDEDARAEALAREKTLSFISAISFLVNLDPAADRARAHSVLKDFLMDFNTPAPEGSIASQHAGIDVIVHLVCQLAAARGEPPAVTWRREATELTRRISEEE